jgi:hypothetical protein
MEDLVGNISLKKFNEGENSGVSCVKIYIDCQHRTTGEGYLRKIPVLRLNFPRHSAREIFRLSTGIFRKYPSHT